MQTHVKVLGVLYIALSALMLMGALFLFVAIGGAATIAGMSADADDAALAVPILGFIGTTLTLFLVIIGLPGLIAGWGLLQLKPWARIFGIVLSAISLVNIPFGTILGAYGLWVLLNNETERLFRPTTVAPTT